ncbi:zinc-binding dehydrogenase [Rhodococcus jostii]|uniref:alcohol dehydrogenase n=1 Tax=Rhodococcus jostii TaxID=132919 RepID=A0A1H5MI14_RHOJO|nr:zinc-binding dehydrogenase [Rhodococcus jostii]SEE89042.1 putative phosphonate catabolism associated alcohol dehydrogenase [Rhodococcus jostii]
MDQIAPRVTRAAIWTGDTMTVRDVPVPLLAPGEVLVRVGLATVCGSDLHTVSGRRPGACPSILGHEAVGHVIAVGGDAAGESVTVGERIVWSVTVACGHCPRCRVGFTAKCTNVRKTGHEAFEGDWALSGSYAEHIILPPGTTIVPVPPHLPDAVAAPAACATATVMAALDAAGDVTGRRVLICGAGMLGVTAAAACAEAGAHVRITDINPQRLTLAHRFGAKDDDGTDVDVAVDFSGSADAVAGALGRLGIGGRLVLAGSVSPGPAIAVDPEAVVRRWLTITGVHNYEPRHLTHAVAFLTRTSEQFPWEDLVAEPVPLDDIATVMAPPPPNILRASIAP